MNTNKRRGKYFEDKIVNIYRQIFKLNKYECYRAGSSGARTTIEYNGDVSFADPKKYPLITECKYYKNMILDHFFPVCNSYIDNWLLQINQEKQHYIQQFNTIPLVLIIAGRPYNSNHHNVIIEDRDLLEKIEDLELMYNIKEYMKFTSSKLQRQYILIDFMYIKDLLEAYKIIRINNK